MSKGRRVPPVVFFDPPPPPTQGYQRAQDLDCAFFTANPTRTEYSRAYVPGEAFPEMPAGTTVHVKRVGLARRIRAFCPPKDLEVRN